MRPIQSTLHCAALLLAAALPAVAQPVVAALQNNYSYALPGTPSYGIARGSIFILYGSGVGPAALLTQGFSPALNRNLGGVSVKVTVAGVTTEAIPYYVSAAQIAAILPSATPAGDGVITVTFNGQTSAPKPIKVVNSAFGVLTLSGAGSGTAAVYDAGYNYVTLTRSAMPGQTVIFWGTGLGSDSNDETRLIASPRDLSEIPIEVYIGNQLASVAYHGRSGFPGLDQINVVIPQGVSGCYVSVYIKTGTYLSNFTTIPVSASGGPCTEPNGLSATQVEQALSGQSVSAGWLYVGRYESIQPGFSAGGIVIPGSTTTVNTGTAQFLRYSPFDFSNYGGQSQASIGSCVVNTYRSDAVFTPPYQGALDAGTVTLRIPDGSTKTLQRGDAGTHFVQASSATPGDVLFIPEAGGTFQFNGSGGADIGPFQASITLAPPLVWSNRTSITSISRANSLEITWTGGEPNSYVWITGVSTDGGNPSLITVFNCTAPVAAGRFTIPAAVLSSLVPSFTQPGVELATGQLAVANYKYPTTFTATGLNVGLLGSYQSITSVVAYR